MMKDYNMTVIPSEARDLGVCCGHIGGANKKQNTSYGSG